MDEWEPIPINNRSAENHDVTLSVTRTGKVTLYFTQRLRKRRYKGHDAALMQWCKLSRRGKQIMAQFSTKKRDEYYRKLYDNGSVVCLRSADLPGGFVPGHRYGLWAQCDNGLVVMDMGEPVDLGPMRSWRRSK